MTKNILRRFIEHPDKDEIISKLIMDKPPSDIHEWLKAKYSSVGENKFVISEKSIVEFKKEYLDLYNTIKEDGQKVKGSFGMQTSDDQVKDMLATNPAYHEKLSEYLDKEIDIRTVIKKMVVNIEHRASQVFDNIQEDPRNIKMDRTLIEWFNTLTNILEKYDTIINGNPDQILQQNNINIQIVDQHINVVYDIIKEILSKLDYDTSLLFIDMFNEKMQKIKPPPEKELLPIDVRLAEAKSFSENITTKLNNQ